MSQCPRVTIGIPVYNGEPFLRETFDSISSQTFTDYELIVSDNASTDGTERICREYAARDPRVTYFRNSRNVGVARNFQRIVDHASGTYFKLANADDLFDPRLVEECVAVLDGHPEVVLCYGKTVLIDEEGEVIQHYEDNLDLRHARAAERFRLALRRLRLVNVLAGVMRTATLRRTGGLGTYVASDMVLVPELALHGQFYELPEFLFYRRMHEGASSGIKTIEGDQQFWDPLRKPGRPLATWQRYRGYSKAILHAPVPYSEKLWLLGDVMRHAFRFREDLLGELLDSMGVRTHG